VVASEEERKPELSVVMETRHRWVSRGGSGHHVHSTEKSRKIQRRKCPLDNTAA